MKTKKSQIELHVHPYFNAYELEDIIKAMDENEIDIIALEYLNGNAFADVQNQIFDLKNKGYIVNSDNIAVKVEKDEKEFYILKAGEWWSSDNFHLLTIGSDNIEQYIPLGDMIFSALKKNLCLYLIILMSVMIM